MSYSVIPVWSVEDEEGNRIGVYGSNSKANEVRAALVEAARLKSLDKSPEQPSYKHPEKEIFNLSEDTTRETDPSLVDPEKVYRGDGPTTDPITPMADLNPTQQDNYFDGLPNGQAQE